MEYEAGVNTAHGKSKRNLYLIAGTVTILAFAIIFVVVLICTIKTGHGLKETVMSRCQSYVDPYTSASSVQYCEDIWSAFEQAYVGKDPCSVPPEAYNPLINSFQQKIPCHKNLFWSRTKDMAHAFTKNRDCLITLEDTLVGFMFDELKWCSSKGSKETFTKDCHGGTECPNNPVYSFWSRASENFAATACGNVSVMLNGSIDTPFNPESTFGSIEVKNFNPAIIESLTVLLVNKETDRTTCSDESLENLQSILSSGHLKSVSYKCRVVHQSKVKDCIDDQKTLCGNCW